MPRRKKDVKKKAKKILTKKNCRFCADDENVIDFKRPRMLTYFLTERGKIVTRRMTGNCKYHQTRVVESIKRARHLALLPYTVTHAVRD